MEETNLKNSGNAGQPPAEGQLGENLKKLAESIDLQGSLGGSLGGTARGRRRQREVRDILSSPSLSFQLQCVIV